MSLKILFPVFAMLVSTFGSICAQTITHGPIIGGVTDTSATIYLRTSQATPVTINVRTKDGQVASDYKGLTIADKDSSAFIQLSSLKPDTYYQCSIKAGNSTTSASFTTFPVRDSRQPLVFTFGSCIENMRTDSIFLVMQQHHPDLFLHLGDWTYPDHEDYPEEPHGGHNYFYSATYPKVEEAYRVRYSMPLMSAFLAQTPADFIHDDDDFVFDGNSLHTQSGSMMVEGHNVLFENPLPDNARANAIKGYLEHFPHYPVNDPVNGLYHSYRMGNIEIFFLDSRADRDSENDAFKIKNGKIKFAPDADHSLLGKEQMQWLLDGLSNSTADWKFILSGTNFNMAYRRTLDLALLLQNQEVKPGMTGGMIASSLAAMWIGYPHDQAKLINYLADNKIKNVVLLSGDAHCSAIDDGANSGIPEVMSGNLGVENSQIPYLLYNEIGLDLWNHGGQGINNTNFNNCFGKIEVFGADSLYVTIVDIHGDHVTEHTFKNGLQVKHVKLRQMRKSTLRTRARLLKDFVRFVGRQMSH
jgi:alkaline phosphatase D